MRHLAASAAVFVLIGAVLLCEGLAHSESVALFRQGIDARSRGDIAARRCLGMTQYERTAHASHPAWG